MVVIIYCLLIDIISILASNFIYNRVDRRARADCMCEKWFYRHMENHCVSVSVMIQ